MFISSKARGYARIVYHPILKRRTCFFYNSEFLFFILTIPSPLLAGISEATPAASRLPTPTMANNIQHFMFLIKCCEDESSHGIYIDSTRKVASLPTSR